ncbi:MAG TPA: VOC family protein [Stellaceae bacterium]|nr:VOC family protein [Stellaceae bacterium]
MPDTTTAKSVEVSPIKVRKIGHLVYEVSDVERTVKFWTEIMGFKISDRNEFGMVFLRTASDHHTIAVAPGQAKERQDQGLRVDHLALEVASMDELIAARDYLKSKGVRVTWEGRRGPGGNPGFHCLDPDGFEFELYTEMDQIDERGVSRPPNQWSRVGSLEDAKAKPLPKSW